MSTVLLRLSAPVQAYATTSLWEERSTGSRPTKSAVAGAGRQRHGLRVGHRPDRTAHHPLRRTRRPARPTHPRRQPNRRRRALPRPPLAAADNPGSWYGAPRNPTTGPGGTLTASWAPEDRGTVLITKHFLIDAAFLAGLTTPDPHFAERILTALQSPRRPLYLGRRRCVPAHPIGHGITPHGPEHWPSRVPLLPEASTPTPQAWTETAPAAGTIPSPEQVPSTFATRDHPLMHLRTDAVSPPPAVPEPAA